MSAPGSSWRQTASRYGGAAYKRLKSADIEVTGALLMDLASAGIMIAAGAVVMGAVKKLEPSAPPATAGAVMATPPKETPQQKKMKSAHAAAIAAIIVGSLGLITGLAYFSTAQVNKNKGGPAPKHQCTMAWFTAVMRLGMGASAGALGGLGLDVIVENQTAIGQMSADDQKHFTSAQNLCAASLAAVGAQLGGAAIAAGHAACGK